jgi:hypothetical protein
MKLKNKKTGEIGYFCFANWNEPTLIIMDKNGVQLAKHSSLAELNKEWEDYEEEKDYWYINALGDVIRAVHKTEDFTHSLVAIGNHFETPEEAEKAVRKLEAWKRLNNCGLKFIDWWLSKDNHIIIGTNRQIFDIDEQGLRKDIDLLFGGEE